MILFPNLGAFWLHFESILASFWVDLGAKWRWRPSFGGSQGGGATTSRKIIDFGVVLGSPWASFFVKINISLDQKMHHFFDVFFEAFGVHFGRRLGSILHPKTCLERKM